MEEMPPRYEPKEIDPKWYTFWEEEGFFKADHNSEKEPYSIVMPPPNVTGVLHMGHALVSTIQDILIRWKRMSGFETLWVPGVDHAGIATQTVVERELIAKEGKRRRDYPREEFLRHVWNWKDAKEGQIVGQLKQLGCSCDWSRYRFTMDEGCTRAVRTIFKRLFDQGLIYQGDYLVNWDPVTQTALADEEIEYIDRTTTMWHIRYPFADGSGEIVIATTRPEMMLGDTGVAVHPDDERYKKLVGKTIRLPITGREIPLIADHFVDPKFGTGAVKLTPGHDPNDYQAAQRHNLPIINLLSPDGKIEGVSVEEMRAKVVAQLEEEGFLLKKEPHTHRVGISYRSKAIIEPRVSKQWFVKMESFKPKLRAAVEEGKVKLIPKQWEATYYHWIDNLRDWCISRQLWWGHQIPIWTHKESGKQICYDGVGIPAEVAAEPDAWEQDPDALDTWFSSGLWPFSTLGWPEETGDLRKFYPNSVLVTGHDILFFWIARMILMGEYALGEVPFPESFIHGLIYGRSYWRKNKDGGITYCSNEERIAYDKGEEVPKDVHSKWEKLSKSKGNVIDPVEIIDEYGTDAMRMALCASSPQNLQIDLDRRRFEEFKHFANKIWNGARFVMMHLEGVDLGRGIDEGALELEDRWILSVLSSTVEKVNSELGRYAFDHAAMTAYDFFWKEFCAYYVELCKPTLFGKRGEKHNKQVILTIVLCQAIRLLHPMAPFITEELFDRLKHRVGKLQDGHLTEETVKALSAQGCAIAPYPTPILSPNSEVEAAFGLVQEIVYAIRNIRGEMKLSPGSAVDVYLVGGEGVPTHLVGSLVKVGKVEVCNAIPELPFSCTATVGEITVVVQPPEADLAKEQERLEKEAKRLEGAIAKVEGQLSNANFVERAPAELVEKTQANLAQLKREYAEISQRLSK